MLSVGFLEKSFGGRKVLSVQDFAAEGGNRTLIYGENGGGKTTLLKILAGLLLPDVVKEWRFNSVQQSPSRRGIDGAVLLHQSPFMFAASVKENVAFASAARVEESLEWAGLSSLADMPARELSGGERARVSLARARAARPMLCLMDEPAAHLDDAGLPLIWELAAELQKQGSAVIVAVPANTIPDADSVWRLYGGDLQREK